MNATRRQISALIVALTMGSAPAHAGPALSSIDRAELDSIIHDYIMAHPEVIAESMEILQARMNAAAEAKEKQKIASSLEQLQRDKADVVLGNPNGDITLVEFFDYNCHYCKVAVADVFKLIDTDKNLRVVLKEYPILGPSSAEVAAVAVAARQQLSPQAFRTFYVSLMERKGQVTKDVALDAAKLAGANVDQLNVVLKTAEVQSQIDKSVVLGRDLGITGTPGFFIADERIVGAVGYDTMKSKIDAFRKCGKAVCS